MVEAPDPGVVHLQALARGSRATGTRAAAVARQYCRKALTKRGFRVVERPFEYSAFPGALATPLAGVWALATITAAMLLGAHDLAMEALVVLVVSGAALAAAARWAARAGVLHAGILRRRGVNLEATRGAIQPSVWLVAHVDSKSQLVPMIARVAGIIGVAAAWIAGVVLAGVAIGPGVAPWLWWAVLAIGGTASVPVMLTLVGSRSAGAVDNASGVAAVLAAAAELPAHAAVGVLVTDAEEMGLAGARAWCQDRPRAIALNCDGVDDGGPIRAAFTSRRPHRVLDVIARVADESGLQVSPQRLLPGVLVDGVAFSDAGWEAATLMRGTLGTLRRVHTASDNLDNLTGSGIAEVAHLLARAALELC